MALQITTDASEAHMARSGFGPLVLAALSGIGVGFAVLLTIMCGEHIWNFDSTGHPIINDFVSFWAAGKLALAGHARAAYDPVLRHAAEIATVGHPFPDLRGWWYPPLFLFVVTGLASLSYAAAFNVMNNVTLVLHAGMTAVIARRRAAFMLAAATPWGMFGMIHGQDQFLSAFLMGAIFLSLERKPALCGILLGLLTYKPQLGVLFPVALAFGGYWRVFGWACVGAVLWTLLSGAVFGFDTFIPFLRGLFVIGNESLASAPGYLPNLQSLYGLARCLRLPPDISWGLQACLSLSCAIAVAALWRSRSSFELKVAGLAAAIPLVLPYFEAYDLAVLSVAFSFLYRQRPFRTGEWCAIAVTFLSFGTFWWQTAHPATLIACIATGVIIAWRLAEERTLNARSSSVADRRGQKFCASSAAAGSP